MNLNEAYIRLIELGVDVPKLIARIDTVKTCYASERFIQSVFVWNNTEEGQEYWSHINTKIELDRRYSNKEIIQAFEDCIEPEAIRLIRGL